MQTVAPSCPNCRERMSDVEQGLGGVWSCIYCEGVWLPKDEGVELPDQQAAPVVAHLVCPSCNATTFCSVFAATCAFHTCTRCGGTFLPKGVVHAISPGSVNPSAEAKVPELMLAAIAGALFLAPDLLVAKLVSSKPGTK